MGEIVIKIPTNKKRKYVIADSGRANKLIDALDRPALRVKDTSTDFTPQQLEDARDYEAAQRNLEEMRRTGVSYSVDELRAEFGLA